MGLTNSGDDWTTQAPDAMQGQVGGSSSSLESAWGGSPSPTPPAASKAAPASGGQSMVEQLGVAPAPAAGAGGSAPDYTPHVAAVNNASDPQSAAVAQDQMARTVASDLKSAGHDVSYSATGQMMVDGRPYDIGGNLPRTNVTPGAAPSTPAAPGVPTDAASIQQSITQSWADAHGGQAIPPDQLAYWTLKAQTPDTYSDGYIRVGWNPYLATRMNTGSASADPALAGMDGVIGRDPGGSAAGTPGGAPGGGTIDYNQLWSGPSPGSTYSAGQIGEADLPFDYASLQASMNAPTVVDAATTGRVNDLLTNPDSLDPRTVQMMESRDAEQQMESARSADQEAQRQGYKTGLTDAPWLASQRASDLMTANNQIIGNRRNIEITAAQTNKADERAAAQIGVGYQNQLKGQQQEAVKTAVSGALAKAAESRNRFELNENLKLEAAKLNLSADTLKAQYAMSVMSSLDKRYGVDVGAQIDYSKLREQSTEFQSEFLYKLQALDQQDKQFGANLGLQYDQLNNTAMNQYWDGTTAAPAAA